MSIHPPLTIAGGTILLPDGSQIRGGVRCEQGFIVAVGADVTAQDGDVVFDARGKLIAPGLVDIGVFAIDKPAFHFGGITRAALMPDQIDPARHSQQGPVCGAVGKTGFLGSSAGRRHAGSEGRGSGRNCPHA